MLLLKVPCRPCKKYPAYRSLCCIFFFTFQHRWLRWGLASRAVFSSSSPPSSYTRPHSIFPGTFGTVSGYFVLCLVRSKTFLHVFMFFTHGMFFLCYIFYVSSLCLFLTLRVHSHNVNIMTILDYAQNWRIAPPKIEAYGGRGASKARPSEDWHKTSEKIW